MANHPKDTETINTSSHRIDRQVLPDFEEIFGRVEAALGNFIASFRLFKCLIQKSEAVFAGVDAGH